MLFPLLFPMGASTRYRPELSISSSTTFNRESPRAYQLQRQISQDQIRKCKTAERDAYLPRCEGGGQPCCSVGRQVSASNTAITAYMTALQQHIVTSHIQPQQPPHHWCHWHHRHTALVFFICTHRHRHLSQQPAIFDTTCTSQQQWKAITRAQRFASSELELWPIIVRK